MIYNIHPIVVHFPVALLFIYSVLKVLPMKRWAPRFAWSDVERVFLVLGFGGALMALSTGETAEHLVRSASNRDLIEVHSVFANASVAFYGALLLAEVISVLHAWSAFRTKFSKLDNFLNHIYNFLTKPLISKLLALLGLVALSITGLLGGVLVYGVSADPFAPLVLKLLGL